VPEYPEIVIYVERLLHVAKDQTLERFGKRWIRAINSV
jgi:hypothetical protein